MLHIITSIQDPYIELVKDDPVRPWISQSQRVEKDHTEIIVLLTENKPQAVVCVAYCDSVPASERDLGNRGNSVAVFYTIWSYQKGAGRELINQARLWLEIHRPTVHTFVTLSPKTEMAKVFHHKNGAVTLRENPDTINYQYQ